MKKRSQQNRTPFLDESTREWGYEGQHNTDNLEPIANINLKGEKFKVFKLRTKQGCQFSPNLFNIEIAVLGQ